MPDTAFQKTLKRAHRILDAARSAARPDTALENRLDEMQVIIGYAEPGYGDIDDVVVFGNWNDIDRWNPETDERETLSRVPSRVCALLERAGASIEWSDKWDTCDGCQKALRTQPDSYGWTRSYAAVEGSLSCRDCLAEDASDYLATMEDNPESALSPSLGIDPTHHGYVLVAGDFERGLHPGQAADPHAIADVLRASDVGRFLFAVDSVGQFDASFSVYVHEDTLQELAQDAQQEHYQTCDDPDFCICPAPSVEDAEDPERAQGWGLAFVQATLRNGQTDSAESPATVAQRALKGLPAPEPGRPVHSTINLDTGETITRPLGEDLPL